MNKEEIIKEIHKILQDAIADEVWYQDTGCEEKLDRCLKVAEKELTKLIQAQNKELLKKIEGQDKLLDKYAKVIEMVLGLDKFC